MPTLLTVRKLAEQLGLHQKTIYRLCAEGKLPYLKIGGALRFDLVRVLESLEQQSAAAVR